MIAPKKMTYATPAAPARAPRGASTAQFAPCETRRFSLGDARARRSSS